MREQSKSGVGSDGLISRRSLLTGALAACVGASCFAEESDQSQTDEEQERRSVEAIAAKAGLRPFRATRSRHFLGIGNASDAFRSLTLGDCEAVAVDYLDYYQSQGFKVAMPAERLTVVILADESSLAAFNGERRVQKSPAPAKPHLVSPGRYESATNRLVVFDLHSVSSQRIGVRNLQLLAHEATHQLTFNTGLLRRGGDVPHSIVEGLGEYGSIRKTTGRTPPGQLNQKNLGILVSARRASGTWYPVAQLLADDRLFAAFTRHQALAYAESWLLIDYLMKDRSRRQRFQAYLEAIRPRIDPKHRLDDATKHLGDLNRLNEELQSYFVQLNQAL